jgi:ABC-type sugar transport system substrate-binding protein
MSIPRIALIALVAAALAAVAIAVWPASEADKARDDGERVGEAVGELYYADTEAEVDAALADLDEAVADTRDHAGDEVAEQVEQQADALERAVDGYAGAVSSEDAFEADLYEAELEVALDDLSTQASDFRAQGPEVQQAFWEGFEDGLPEE